MPNHVTNQIRFTDSTPDATYAAIRDCVNSSGWFDFNKIIPMPSTLNVTEGSLEEAACEALKGNVVYFFRYHHPDVVTASQVIDCLKNDHPESFDRIMREAKLMVDNEKKYGFRSWYDWSRHNWGTKWNAYSCCASVQSPAKRWNKNKVYAKRIFLKRLRHQLKSNNSEVFIGFDTAWSMPEPIALALSAKHPDQKIEWNFADEDLGSNCGTVLLVGGQVVSADLAGRWDSMTDENKRKWKKFAFELCYPGVDQRTCGYDENWEYDEDLEAKYG